MENRIAQSSSSFPPNLTGALVVAHPGLPDPNFRKTVVLISSHSEDGAVGTVINQPLGLKLAEFDPAYANDPLGRIKMYRGGPVGAGEVVFMAWKWSMEESTFRLAYGLKEDQARNLLDQTGYEVRGFLGYAGWGEGQLEEELEQDSWVVSGIDAARLGTEDEGGLWRDIIASISPEMKIQADAPEDPGLN
jgi:putative transcriptional regulator